MRQPWLPGSPPLPVPDDFSAQTRCMSAGRVAAALAIMALLLLMGRSKEILDAVFGLDPSPLADALLVVAEAWHGAMMAIGVAPALGWLHAVLGFAA
ncbi:MAG: hypothetical protein NTW56_05930 [Alphaproteobacteria bacterium]|nr:hypothetical protein [Alphaproteobacteria bacterium]